MITSCSLVFIELVFQAFVFLPFSLTLEWIVLSEWNLSHLVEVIHRLVPVAKFVRFVLLLSRGICRPAISFTGVRWLFCNCWTDNEIIPFSVYRVGPLVGSLSHKVLVICISISAPLSVDWELWFIENFVWCKIRYD